MPHPPAYQRDTPIRDAIVEFGILRELGLNLLGIHLIGKPGWLVSMRPMPSMPLRAVAVTPHVWHELPHCVQLRGPGSQR
jgi:hypothetical protein